MTRKDMFRLKFQKKHQRYDDLNTNKYSLILLDAFGVKKQSWLTLENEPVLTQNRNSDSEENTSSQNLGRFWSSIPM